MLKSNESLFINSTALEYDFQPKLVPYREDKQQHMAYCIKPLFNKTNGRNLFMHGPPGIGKTVACKHVLKELEEQTDEIMPIHVNCWTLNTTYKIFMHMCELLGHKFIQNKKSDELFGIIQHDLNKKSAVFVFDEADKLEDLDFLYTILEGIYRKSIILITNDPHWLDDLDLRIKSRLIPEIDEFKPYNAIETKGILEQRKNYAFVPEVWDEIAFRKIIEKTVIIRDIRSGLYLMKESGLAAEEESSKKILLRHVESAISKFDQFSVNDTEELGDETSFILEIIKAHPGEKIGELFKEYQGRNGKQSYKTFQRNIGKLEHAKFISLEKLHSGDGNSTIVTYVGQKMKTLSDF